MYDVASWLFGMMHGKNMAEMQRPAAPRRPTPPPEPISGFESLASPSSLPPEILFDLAVRSRQRPGIIMPPDP